MDTTNLTIYIVVNEVYFCGTLLEYHILQSFTDKELAEQFVSAAKRFTDDKTILLNEDELKKDQPTYWKTPEMKSELRIVKSVVNKSNTKELSS